MAEVKRVRILNIVHNDEIWKDHIRHEQQSTRRKWPETWGYLVGEYKKMNCELEGRPISVTPRPTSSKATRNRDALDGLKLPPIPARLKSFPETTSREIGWKSVQNGLNSELVTRYGEIRRGKTSIVSRLRWPNDGLP